MYEDAIAAKVGDNIDKSSTGAFQQFLLYGQKSYWLEDNAVHSACTCSTFAIVWSNLAEFFTLRYLIPWTELLNLLSEPHLYLTETKCFGSSPRYTLNFSNIHQRVAFWLLSSSCCNELYDVEVGNGRLMSCLRLSCDGNCICRAWLFRVIS